MTEVIHRRTDCRACGSADLELVFALQPSPIGDAYVTHDRIDQPQPSYPIDLHMCRDCGLAQILDVIDPGILYGEYIYVTASSLELTEHFRSYADTVIGRCGVAPGSLVVDIGSNDGTLLRPFRERGMRVLGVEPAAHIAAQATASGIETIAEFFTPEVARIIAGRHGRAKVVTANNVFANIDDLRTWVNAVDELLASDGVFIFESFYLADLVRNMVFDFIYHEHLSAFSVKPIRSLFLRAGMELVAVQRVATKGGSVRYFVQRPGGPLADDRSVAQLLALEDEVGLYRKETFTAFREKVDRLKAQTRAFLEKAKSEGKSVAGFGASITGTTLIYDFEIGEYLDYLVDDNPAKQGRYSPGLHLPVVPSAVLDDRRPDYVIILAWRYAEPFIKKNWAYLDGGGCFVVPVPELKFITRDLVPVLERS
jgi:SAM-dependent methyltransferase